MNIKLAQQYGTGTPEHNRLLMDTLYKQASLMGVASSFAAADLVDRDIEKQKAEAEVLNEMIAHFEANRMAPATRSIRRSQAPAILPHSMGGMIPVGMDQGMVRIASAAGADLAQLEKEAFLKGLGALGRGFGAATKGAFSGIGGMAKNKATGLGNAFSSAASKVKSAPGNMANKFNAWGESQGQKMQQWGQNKASLGKAPAPQLGAAVGNTPKMQAPQAQVASPPPVNVNTPAGSAPDKSWLQRTGLFDAQGNFRKYRALGAAATLGAGYLGFKAAKGAIDYMGQHPTPASYNTGGPQLQMGVNQYGQPSFSGY